MLLSRDKTGKTIHRTTCRHARVVWLESYKMTRAEVQVAAATLGMVPCRTCKPLYACKVFKCDDFRANGHGFCREHIL